MVNSKESRSYCITLRPGAKANGLNETLKKKAMNWCKRQDYAFMVMEKDGHESHLHIQSWHNEPLLRNTVGKAFQRFLFDSYDAGSYLVGVALNIKMGFNDWWDHYLKENPGKTEDVDILYEALPALTEAFYPTEEEQTEIQEKALAGDKRFYHYLKGWEEYAGNPQIECTLLNVCEFLALFTFNKKANVRVIWKQGERVQTATALKAYIDGSAGNLTREDAGMLFMGEKDQMKYIIRPMLKKLS